MGCVIGGVIEGGAGAGGGGGGAGDFVGPASALDGSIVLFDGTTGKLGKDAAVVLTAAGKALLDDANAAAQLTTLGVSAFVQTVLDDADAATVRATIGAGTGNGTIGGSTGATDNAVLRADGTGGATVQASSPTIDDNGVLALSRGSAGQLTQMGGTSGSDPGFYLHRTTGSGDDLGTYRLDVNTANDSAMGRLGAGRIAVLAGHGSSPGVFLKDDAAIVGSTSVYAFSATGSASDGSRDAGFYRAGVNVIGTCRGHYSLLGGTSLLTNRLVEANTAGSGSPNVLAAAESRTLLTNEGTTAENYHTLPSAAAGLEFEFYCQDTDGIRVVANTGDTIRLSAGVSAAAGFVKSVVAGSFIRLVAINATEWVRAAEFGTWTIDV